jgi:hypothetical protein
MRDEEAEGEWCKGIEKRIGEGRTGKDRWEGKVDTGRKGSKEGKERKEIGRVGVIWHVTFAASKQ